jgi:RND family efflux transporter MFP subunit
MFNQSTNRPFVLCIAAYTFTASVALQAEEIQPIDCMIEPNIMVEISSPVDGVLDTLLVDRSDEVKKGEILATLKSDVEQVAVDMSMERLKLSQVIYNRARGLYRKKVITLTERDRLDNENKLAELNLQHAEANLEMKQIRSPIDGVVVKRYSSPGEFVEADPIIKLAQLNPLKIEVISPVSNYGKIVKGMRAKILPDSGSYPGLIAEVVVVDKVIDAASGTFGIRLELANKDYTIPSGLKCKVRFLPQTKQSTRTKATPENFVVTEEVVTPVAQMADKALMCLTVGPYKAQKIINDLIDELGSDIMQTALRTDIKAKKTYLAVSKSFDTLKETKEKMQSMQDAGITDVAIINGSGKPRIALGLYSRQTFANERVEKLKNKGYKVHIKPIIKDTKEYWADIAYLSQSAKLLTDLIPATRRSPCDEAIKLSLLK